MQIRARQSGGGSAADQAMRCLQLPRFFGHSFEAQVYVSSSEDLSDEDRGVVSGKVFWVEKSSSCTGLTKSLLPHDSSCMLQVLQMNSVPATRTSWKPRAFGVVGDLPCLSQCFLFAEGRRLPSPVWRR